MRYTNQQIIAAINTAPPQVQEALHDDKTVEILSSIGKQYKLHVDTIGRLAELNRNLLLGLMAPAEVLGELVMANVDTETAKKILGDLNEKIFIPVRNKLHEATTKPEPEQIESQSSPSSTRSIAVPNIPTFPAPAPANISIESKPALRTMESDMQTAKGLRQTVGQGVSVHIQDQVAHPVTGQPAASVHVFIPSQPTAQPSTLPNSSVPVVAQPHSLPERMPQTPLPAIPPVALKQPGIAALNQIPASQAHAASPNSATDPYREPI